MLVHRLVEAQRLIT